MLEQWVHSVESGLRELGRQLLRPDPREQVRDEMDRLLAQLRERRAELDRARLELAAMKRRLRDNPTEAALLHSRIESAIRVRHLAEAYRYAIELDQLRQTLTSDETACPRLEQTCWSLQFLLRLLERRIARLQENLYPT